MFPLYVVVSLANLPVCLIAIVWLTYQSTFVHIKPLEQFSKSRPRLWHVIRLALMLGAVVLTLLVTEIFRSLPR